MLNKGTLDAESSSMVSWCLSRIQILRPTSTVAAAANLEALRQTLSLSLAGRNSGLPPPPTLLCLDSLTSFHYQDDHCDSLADPSGKGTGAISGANDYFVLLRRLRSTCPVLTFATKSLLYQKDAANERTTPQHWNRSVTHAVTLVKAVEGGEEERGGYDRVAKMQGGSIKAFRISELREVKKVR